MRNLFMACVSVLLLSCGSLTSITEIEAKSSFVLGNNEHGKFHVKIKNLSDQHVKVFQEPILGGSHSPQIINAFETIKIQVEKNTALRFQNNSSKQISVGLKILGDVGLSMGYVK